LAKAIKKEEIQILVVGSVALLSTFNNGGNKADQGMKDTLTDEQKY
jgi:hypothetical protein